MYWCKFLVPAWERHKCVIKHICASSRHSYALECCASQTLGFCTRHVWLTWRSEVQGGIWGGGGWDMAICWMPTLTPDWCRAAFGCTHLLSSSKGSTEPSRLLQPYPGKRQYFSLPHSSSPKEAPDAAMACQHSCSSTSQDCGAHVLHPVIFT